MRLIRRENPRRGQRGRLDRRQTRPARTERADAQHPRPAGRALADHLQSGRDVFFEPGYGQTFNLLRSDDAPTVDSVTKFVQNTYRTLSEQRPV